LILVLQTTTFGAHGGIPTYNRVVCRALKDFTAADKQVLIVTDQRNDVEQSALPSEHLKFKAFSGNRSAFATNVVRFALTTRIDLLLVGHVNYAPLGLLCKILQPKLRYGVMVHGVDVWSRLPLTKGLALRRADFVTSVSEYSRQKAIEVNGVQADRIRLLPNALEWIDRENGQMNATTTAGIKLLSVCRLDARERYKGVDTVLKALPSVVTDFPDLTYYVIGSGSDFERHRELATRLGLSHHVQFLGSVDESTLRSHYEQCDVFLMPSAGEGFGIVFLEAMKYRKPVIAAASGAVSEVIKHGETGTLVRYGDIEATAAAIIELAMNPQRSEAMGRAGFERLMNNFTYKHFKKRFYEILQEEMQSKSFYLSRRNALELVPTSELPAQAGGPTRQRAKC
jgi:phosphatidyl-myo-inositol dimannoside synthase